MSCRNQKSSLSSNNKKGLSKYDLIRQKALDLEAKVLSLSGLELVSELHVLDIPINFKGENYIHTTMCGEDNKEV